MLVVESMSYFQRWDIDIDPTLIYLHQSQFKAIRGPLRNEVRGPLLPNFPKYRGGFKMPYIMYDIIATS